MFDLNLLFFVESNSEVPLWGVSLLKTGFLSTCFFWLCKGGWFSNQFRNKVWDRNMLRTILFLSALLFLAEARPQSCKFLYCYFWKTKNTSISNYIMNVLSVFRLSYWLWSHLGMSWKLRFKPSKQVCSPGPIPTDFLHRPSRREVDSWSFDNWCFDRLGLGKVFETVFTMEKPIDLEKRICWFHK